MRNDQIEVVYTNDSGSRDLRVDYDVVDGRTVQAEGGAMAYDRGSGSAAFDGLDVLPGQQALYWNGALRFVAGNQAYAACYDANGNMTWRIVDGSAYQQVWDAENRLVQVKKNSLTQATFVYDGDGSRVKATVGSTTTAYVGAYYEKQGAATTRYYHVGGLRVAMRTVQGLTNTLYYLLGDHLGSTSITVSSGGAKVAELRYKAWGEVRYASGATPTTFRFTGQRLEEGPGIYVMGARWYDPRLARWLSADSIVPNPANPQAFNRYSWVLNQPLLYIDPSGQKQVCNKNGTICADDGTETTPPPRVVKARRSQRVYPVEAILAIAEEGIARVARLNLGWWVHVLIEWNFMCRYPGSIGTDVVGRAGHGISRAGEHGGYGWPDVIWATEIWEIKPVGMEEKARSDVGRYIASGTYSPRTGYTGTTMRLLGVPGVRISTQQPFNGVISYSFQFASSIPVPAPVPLGQPVPGRSRQPFGFDLPPLSVPAWVPVLATVTVLYLVLGGGGSPLTRPNLR